MFLTIKITFRFEACTYIKKVLKTGQVFRTSQCFASWPGTPSGGKIDVDSQIIIHLVSF